MAWQQDEINYDGEIYQFAGVSTDPVRPISRMEATALFLVIPRLLDLCGKHCDVYLMWPETRENLAERMKAVHERAAEYGRVLDYELRVHTIVRDTEAEARNMQIIWSASYRKIKVRKFAQERWTQPHWGLRIRRKNRKEADDKGYIEPHLWTGVGAPALAVVRRWSDQQNRFVRKLKPIAKWVSERLFSQAIRIWMNADILAKRCCQSLRPVLCLKFMAACHNRCQQHH